MAKNHSASNGNSPVPKIDLTVAQFAQAFDLCPRTVNSLIARREVRSYKIGRLRRIPQSELSDFPRRQLEAAEA